MGSLADFVVLNFKAIFELVSATRKLARHNIALLQAGSP